MMVKQKINESILDNCQPRVQNSKACVDIILQKLQVNKELLLNNNQF